MNLLDIYISEIGRRLPRKTHSDIEAEIRSALEDNLEERSKQVHQPVNEAMIAQVLKDYGSPEKVAAGYLPERYLIGPTLYPTFLTVAKVILWVTGAIAVIGLGISLGQSATSLQAVGEIFLKAIGGFWTSILTSISIVVFIFAIIEWAVYYSGENVKFARIKPKPWDPQDLVKIKPTNRIKLGDTIAEVVFTFIAIFLFNFYPQFFSLGYNPNGIWYIGLGAGTSIPILSAAFFSYLPYLTVLWSLTILLDAVLLRQGYWNTWTRLAAIGLKALNVVIAALMLAGPSLIGLTAASIPANAMDPAAVQAILATLPIIIEVALWIAVVGGCIDILRRLYRLFQASYAGQWA